MAYYTEREPDYFPSIFPYFQGICIHVSPFS